MDAYEVPSPGDYRGVDLISDACRSAALVVGNAIGYAMYRNRSHDAVVRVYDAAGNVIERHEHAGEFKEPQV